MLNDLKRHGTQDKAGAHEAKFVDKASIILANDLPPEDSEAEVPNSCTVGFSVDKSQQTLLLKQLEGFFDAHSGGGNYLFMDGHVKWLLPQDASKQQCEVLTPLYGPR